MTTFLIDPRDPLIVRDGRPFDRQPGVLALSLPFPFPSTTTGAVRQRAARNAEGILIASTSAEFAELRRIAVRGPLLVELKDNGTWEILPPAPGDALLLDGQDGQIYCKRLVPLAMPANASSDLAETKTPESAFALVGATPVELRKPAKNPPAFWHWETFQDWLLEPEQKQEAGKLYGKSALGLPKLSQDQRIHIALEPGMMTAREEALFETRGLEFTAFSEESKKLHAARRLALLLDVEVGNLKQYGITPGYDCLGAERRVVRWRESKQPLPVCPPDLIELIVRHRACRLILLTPACFKRGYLPGQGFQSQSGCRPELRAALVQRPQVVSGWDMDKKTRKPTRRLAPSGSVFFLTFSEQETRKSLETWIEQTWMQCVSDDEQDRLDGFGMAVPGAWSGDFSELRVKEEWEQ